MAQIDDIHARFGRAESLAVNLRELVGWASSRGIATTFVVVASA